MIDNFYAKRNFLVHESKDTITENDIFYLKSHIEVVMLYVTNIAPKIKDIGMYEFLLQNLRKRSDILEKESEILELLKEMKEGQD
ncbi:MAG: hypothetical protein ACTSR8_08650 [Promethearchaeota archaeon]